ncbi:hypothetical protein [Actinoplanes friuliensis]|jgi:hypothetical protein|uniref:hypothetical protein n=1 Tax=Actinoplanes friuliensis TaxID=196914 RepID=UPI0011DCF393|nr:hypothetical protein [Actinoplanes friuliensis]
MRGTHTRGRRGTWIAALSVAVLVACTAAVIIGANQWRSDEPVAAPAAPVDPGRRPWQVTLDLDTKAGYVISAGVSDGARQGLTVQNLAFSGKPDGVYGGEVTAFPPGTLDEQQLTVGERVNDAWYVPDFTFAEHTARDGKPWQAPAVGRPDPSGVWVVVYADPARSVGEAAIGRDDLLRLAAAVRVGPARDLRLPLSLGAGLPAGLDLTYVRATDQQLDRQPPTLGLSRATREPSGAGLYARPPGGLDVIITTEPRNGDWDKRRPALTGPTTAGGLQAWYEQGKRLTVEAERCVVTIESALTRAELEKLVDRMTIGDCADPESWIPPLS